MTRIGIGSRHSPAALRRVRTARPSAKGSGSTSSSSATQRLRAGPEHVIRIEAADPVALKMQTLDELAAGVPAMGYRQPAPDAPLALSATADWPRRSY